MTNETEVREKVEEIRKTADDHFHGPEKPAMAIISILASEILVILDKEPDL